MKYELQYIKICSRIDMQTHAGRLRLRLDVLTQV